MKLTLTMLICSFFAAIQPAHSQGYIVPNGIIEFSGYSGKGIVIDVLANPPALPPDTPYYTGFLLFPHGDNTFLYDYIVNIGVRSFFVSPNDPVTLEAIQSGGYTELISGADYVFNNGITFYVGIYTGHGLPTAGIYPDPIFGWAELVNNSGKIELLDGALEYRGDGIYAGTLNIIQPVPEPGTWALTVLGGMILFWKGSRR